MIPAEVITGASFIGLILIVIVSYLIASGQVLNSYEKYNITSSEGEITGNGGTAGLVGPPNKSPKVPASSTSPTKIPSATPPAAHVPCHSSTRSDEVRSAIPRPVRVLEEMG